MIKNLPRLRHFMIAVALPTIAAALPGVAAALSTMGAAALAHGQQDQQAEPAAPLFDNLGDYSRTLDTDSLMAQRYFDQGLQLGYGFGRAAAVASFRMAQRYDPDCAMCYWGEAWTLGPYQNGRMSDEAGLEAYRAIQTAKEKSATSTDSERALIEAMASRYAAQPKDADRRQLDETYVAAMRDVVRRFPNDLDASALFAESLMVLYPWDLWLPDGSPRPETTEATNVLESVLARNIRHVGACHLFIHAVEASPDPRRAEACADLLAAQMPGASHIQHMPSHIYMRIGRYGDAVRSNQRARIVDVEAEHGRGAAIYATHNLDMLAFAAWMDGQSAVAIRAARDLAHDRPRDRLHHLQILVRFGRWEEIMELDDPPTDDFTLGMWEFARGMAQLRRGHGDAATSAAEHLVELSEKLPDDARYQRYSRVDLLRVAGGILMGEIAAAARHYDEALSKLRLAAAVEASFPYSEPEAWAIPVGHVLGAVLLEAGRPAEAQRVYEEELEHHAENGWSLLGLEQSLRAQGDDEAAAAVHERFARAWARADLPLLGSRF